MTAPPRPDVGGRGGCALLALASVLASGVFAVGLGAAPDVAPGLRGVEREAARLAVEAARGLTAGPPESLVTTGLRVVRLEPDPACGPGGRPAEAYRAEVELRTAFGLPYRTVWTCGGGAAYDSAALAR
ncbi:hypothetical protein RQM47_00385 [Rubrivirga sp. S365]|uniref:Uncharacterized protein n=1 Tax=Rubrivirga litoralis TaxID=3075598 RepID=A0ABU3BU48_9BACT|nr:MULTISPECIES: hypothetical protein [unclassified Rubrivirga]MDT0632814.1 hypothetical protein [Rubrivirga sp. F394]MDT7855092.1 hypothetical protein [Rubrivirga sp. S365]